MQKAVTFFPREQSNTNSTPLSAGQAPELHRHPTDHDGYYLTERQMSAASTKPRISQANLDRIARVRLKLQTKSGEPAATNKKTSLWEILEMGLGDKNKKPPEANTTVRRHESPAAGDSTQGGKLLRRRTTGRSMTEHIALERRRKDGRLGRLAVTLALQSKNTNEHNWSRVLARARKQITLKDLGGIDGTDDPNVERWKNIREGFNGKQMFFKAAKLVKVIIQATKMTSRDTTITEAKNLSFAQYHHELLKTKKSTYGELSFDPLEYKMTHEKSTPNEVRRVLCMESGKRTKEDIQSALASLQQAVDAFSEYPIHMQTKLMQVGWYQFHESKRVIIRQGHTADNFYFILSGTVIVTILEKDSSGEDKLRTAAVLGRGNSFGELAIMNASTRSATVSCKDDVELLAVDRDHFVDIFMLVEKDVIPGHIQFLQEVPLLKHWPADELPYNNNKICVFTYFRRGVVMCKDSSKTDWVYIVKTGSCRVLKSLESSKSSRKPSNDVIQNKKVNGWRPTITDTRGRHSMINILRSVIGTDNTLPSIYENDDAGRHKAYLDKIFSEKHPPENIRKKRRTRVSQESQQQIENDLIYINIVKLEPKSIFPLEMLVFPSTEKKESKFSLVSNGTEAIMINKKFFLQHLTDDAVKHIRSTLQPFPTNQELQKKYFDENNWGIYKRSLVDEQVAYNNFVHQTLAV